MEEKKNRYHVIAFVIILVWGVTFISTKTLLFKGLTPEDLFFYRFLIAYIGLWFFGKSRLFAHTLKDEIYFLLLGITGGSIYFLTENYALQYTMASNVALLVCTAPLFTAILTHCFTDSEKITRRLIQGIVVAFIGVGLVIFNGRFILKLNPVGDWLSIAASICWAVYTLFLKKVSDRYSALFITRKVFFYGLLTILPFFLHKPLTTDWQILGESVVFANLLFLGIVASLFCYFFWNIVVQKLGAIPATNYIYMVPVVTLIASALFLGEEITVFAIIGAMLTILGLIWTERRPE
jgi:drug/metabolite transporter (DMT)-like permease